MATHKEIYDYLMANLPWRKPARGGQQIVTRCPNPECTEKSGHFYIGPFNDTTNPIMYNCFKCGMSGILTNKTLAMLGIQDDTFGKELSEFNANIPAYSMNKIGSGIPIFNLVNDFITDCDLSKYKLNYINTRLGTNLTYQDMIQNKIVLNLYDVLKRNYIREVTRDPRIADELNQYFIGFLGADNNYLNMRMCVDDVEVNPSINKRYINYFIKQSDVNCKYYILPFEIDVTSPEPIQVHIAEGPFDILGVYYNVMNQYRYRTIYMAMGGKGYATAIEFVISTLGLTNLQFHIYPDLDIEEYNIEDLGRWIAPFNNDVYIHRNTYRDPESDKQEKDFGVSKNKIITSTRILQKRIEVF